MTQHYKNYYKLPTQYNYLDEKPKMFTEEGQKRFLIVRDRVHKLLWEAGAFMMTRAFQDISGEVWEMMSYVDRLVELGEIREVTHRVSGQNRVFVGVYK